MRLPPPAKGEAEGTAEGEEAPNAILFRPYDPNGNKQAVHQRWDTVRGMATSPRAGKATPGVGRDGVWRNGGRDGTVSVVKSSGGGVSCQTEPVG